MPIPARIFQTAKVAIPEETRAQLRAMLDDECEYEFFDDADAAAFLRSNPLEDFPDAENLFVNVIPVGAHKADFFRYYYIYVRGGVFIDSDAMLYMPLRSILARGYDFFSINSIYNKTVFQGFIGADSGNRIVYGALKNMYETFVRTNASNFKNINYYYFTHVLYQLVNDPNWTNGYHLHMFREAGKTADGKAAPTFDTVTGRTMLVHYFKDKSVPPNLDDETMRTLAPQALYSAPPRLRSKKINMMFT